MQEFLSTNNLKLILRSHEGPDARDKREDMQGMDNGYTLDHQTQSKLLLVGKHLDCLFIYLPCTGMC